MQVGLPRAIHRLISYTLLRQVHIETKTRGQTRFVPKNVPVAPILPLTETLLIGSADAVEHK